MGLYLVQQLSSDIKLRICTALGMTKYPTCPSDLGAVEHYQRDPQSNNSSNWGKTSIRIKLEDQPKMGIGQMIEMDAQSQ